MFDLKISRRDFLVGASKVAVVASVAPAIVKIDNLMKIQVVKTMEEAEAIINSHNFTITGLQKGSSVILMDAVTGERLVLETNIMTTRKSWEIPDRIPGGREIKAVVRKQGWSAYAGNFGAPYPGGKTKVRIAQVEDLVLG
jgi:hypothetical protein